MKTLTLVPLNNTYVNPGEIAAIGPDSFNSSRTVITLRGNQIAVVINWTVDEVIERLKSHLS